MASSSSSLSSSVSSAVPAVPAVPAAPSPITATTALSQETFWQNGQFFPSVSFLIRSLSKEIPFGRKCARNHFDNCVFMCTHKLEQCKLVRKITR